MRVLIVHEHRTAPGKGGGGAESMLRDQTEALKRLGHEAAWLQDTQIELAVRTFQPDVVQVQTIHNLLGFGPAIWLQEKRVPHVWALMDYWPFCGGRMLLTEGVAGRGCAAVTGVCDGKCVTGRAQAMMAEAVNRSRVVGLNRYTAEIYRRNGVRCDYVVELGVDTEAFCPGTNREEREGREEVTIYTSSAWPEYGVKGMSVLAEALVGTRYQANLMAHTERENIAKGLRRAAIYVFPSIYEETFGLGLCEAMASGCACVASDVAGARAQIEDGVTGLLVEKQNPAALREAIVRLAEDEALRRRLGEAARRHVVEDHSLEAMGRRWEAVYGEVMR